MADVKFSELQYSDDTAAAMRALLDKGQNLVYASVKTMNIANGNVGLLVLDGNCTLTISGLANGMYGLLFVTGNGHTLTINGQSVTLNTTGETIVSFSYFFNTLRLSAGGASTSGGGLSLLATPTVTVDSSTSTTITLRWGAVTNATNYIVKVGTTNSVGAATQVYSGSSTNTVITSLTNGQLYYIFVIAHGAGYSDSNPGTAQRTTGDLSGTQLPTPTLALTVDSSTAITAAWDNVANEEGYTVQIATNSGFTTGVQTYNAAANEVSHQFTGLTPGTLYYGRVKAVGDGIDFYDSSYGTDSDTTSAGGSVGSTAAVDAYISRLSTAGHTVSDRSGLDTFISGLNSNGIYDLIHEMWLFIGGTGAAPHLLGFKNVHNLVEGGSGHAYASAGWKGNGSSAYLKTGVLGTDLAQDSVHLALYTKENSTVIHSFGAVDSPKKLFILNLTGSDYSNINDSSNTTWSPPAVSPPPSNGNLLYGRRTASQDFVYIDEVGGSTPSAASTAPPTNELYLGALNENGTANYFTDGRISFASLGAAIPAAKGLIFQGLIKDLQTFYSRA